MAQQAWMNNLQSLAAQQSNMGNQAPPVDLQVAERRPLTKSRFAETSIRSCPSNPRSLGWILG